MENSAKTIAAAALLAAIFVSGTAVLAEPKVEVIYDYYEITGKTGRALKRQMSEKGPKGFWAYTRWHVKWSSDWDVSLTITYTYPKLQDRAQVPMIVRKRWDRMMDILVSHEEGHGNHGIEAANEIEEAECERASAIVQRWAEQDKIYDRETKHGKKQGVSLRD